MKHLLLISLMLPLSAFSARADDYMMKIKNHQFQPSELVVPSGIKFKLVIENQDSTPEEFDSHILNREKIIAGNSTATIYIGPLAPGRYPFIGEFNEATAKGVIVAQ